MSPGASGRMASGRRLSWWVVVAVVFGGFSLAGAPAGYAATQPGYATGAAVSLTLSARSRVIAGAGFGITVTAQDRAGHVATSYRGTVAFTSNDPRGPVLPAAYTFTSRDRGVHAFAKVALHAMGTRTITVTDARTASITAASAQVRVFPGPARRLAVSAPSTATAGVGFDLTVSAQDAWANPAASYRGTVAFTATDATAALPAKYAFTRADMGTRTVTGVVLSTAGSQRVAVTDVAHRAVTGSATVQVRPAATGYSLYAWGSGANGRLGDGHLIDRLWPARVGADARWTALSAGDGHTVAVRSDGTVWSWGANYYGQLGDGTTTDRLAPVQVGTGAHWATVAAGYQHTAAVKTDGTLWAWGDNSHGQLGDGTTTNRSAPVQAGTDTHWASVAAAAWRTMAVKTDGTLWAWGWNSVGQLGDGTTIDRWAPVQVGADTHWACVAAGGDHAVALKTDGTLWAWGVNVHGQLGDGTTTSRSVPVRVGTGTHWARVAAGGDHSVAVETDGTLWTWGDNEYGQLGDGTTTDRSVPVRVGTGTHWASAAAGSGHTVALKTDGTLWAWGQNLQGQLGDGEDFARSVPAQVGKGTHWARVAAGSVHTVALTSGTVQMTGAVLQGQVLSDFDPISGNITVTVLDAVTGAVLRSVAAPTGQYRMVGLPAGRIKIRATMPGYLVEFANHKATLAGADVFTLVNGQTLSQNWMDPLVEFGPYLDLTAEPVS